MTVKITTTILLLLLWRALSFGQSVDSAGNKILGFPTKLFGRIQAKTAGLDQQLTGQTDKYIQRLLRREARLQKRLSSIDSAGANRLFANSASQYKALAQKLRQDTGSRIGSVSGEYHAYTDSLHGTLAFLQQNPQLLATSGQMPAAGSAAASQLQALEARLQDADQLKQFTKLRSQQIGEYISQHTALAGVLGKDYQGMNQELYYYSQQVRQYKELLNNPDAMLQKALAVLSQLPAFKTFMQNNSQLAGLFSMPANYSSAQGVVGLQTRDQISTMIQNQVSAGGAGGAAALQSNLRSAESQLDQYKEKLSQLGAGSGDIDMPDFKPSDQKTKTLWKRLEYGVNFQTTRNDYLFPTVTDLGASVGYLLGKSNTVGLGASYKLGWGNGINHIAFSSQGVGLRSFLNIKLKGSFSATGGFEYNYETPLVSLKQIDHLTYWTQSGLIGITKTISVKSTVFKKTSVSLLWDFLSYQQIPKTQPILFRVGYNL